VYKSKHELIFIQMASVFISHSSVDKPFARKLITSLEKEGHTCWIDEKEIKVGERIVGKIQEGLESSEYLALLLSKQSVQSKWVEEEWVTQYWGQVNSGKVKLLPLLIEECKIPNILQGIKYADFTKGYDIGLAGLLIALGHTNVEDVISTPKDSVHKKQHLANFLAKINGGEMKLSACLSEGIGVAANVESSSLEDFCIKELTGWGKTRGASADEEQPEYRKIYVLLSPLQIKSTYGFSTVEEAFKHVLSEGQGVETRMLLSESVPQLETQVETYSKSDGFYSASHNMSDFNSSAPKDMPAYLYINPVNYRLVLGRIKQELINLVLKEMKA
jgi:hypothetical protein